MFRRAAFVRQKPKFGGYRDIAELILRATQRDR